jgi:hypothetical protein
MEGSLNLMELKRGKDHAFIIKTKLLLVEICIGGLPSYVYAAFICNDILLGLGTVWTGYKSQRSERGCKSGDLKALVVYIYSVVQDICPPQPTKPSFTYLIR